jgi:hypothetical protein
MSFWIAIASPLTGIVMKITEVDFFSQQGANAGQNACGRSYRSAVLASHLAKNSPN